MRFNDEVQGVVARKPRMNPWRNLPAEASTCTQAPVPHRVMPHNVQNAPGNVARFLAFSAKKKNHDAETAASRRDESQS